MLVPSTSQACERQLDAAGPARKLPAAPPNRNSETREDLPAFSA